MLETKANSCWKIKFLSVHLSIDFVTYLIIFSVKKADFCQLTILTDQQSILGYWAPLCCHALTNSLFWYHLQTKQLRTRCFAQRQNTSSSFVIHSQPLCSKLAFPLGQMVKNLPAMQETCVQSLGQEDLLEKEMATYSRILAWKIPWTEEPGGLQSMASQRVRHD